MSAHENEDLIDYEDEAEVTTNGAPAPAAGAAAGGAADGEGDRNFSGIHSTGFRLVFLLV